jgi:HD-like signal output (HDOD) protein
MTTIGKLNFFRWALESNILQYIEQHEDEIRKGYNVYLKDLIQTQKNNKVTVKEQLKEQKEQSRVTRRRTKQSPSSLNKLQVYTTPIELTFD